MKRKLAIAFASLLLLFSSSYKARADVWGADIPALGGILEAVQKISWDGDVRWYVNLENILSQTENIVQMSLNTYTSMDRLVHSSSVLDAVYNGASLLGMGGPKSVFYQDMLNEVYASIYEYQRLLYTIDYYSKLDPSFDVSRATNMMMYGLEELRSLTNYVSGTMAVIREGSDVLAAQRKLDDAKAEAMKKRLEMAQMAGAIDKEYVERLKGDLYSACLSSVPEVFNSLKPDPIGNSTHYFTYAPTSSTGSSSGKLNYSGTASGGKSGSGNALGGNEINKVTSQLQKKGRTIIDENNEDVKKPKEMFRRATLIATDIAEAIALILGIFFIARNYSRRQGDGHQYQNSMLKTIVGTFVIILICEIIKAIIKGAPIAG